MDEVTLDLEQVQGIDEVLEADTSEVRRSYLLVGPSGGHIRVSASLRQLLRWLKEGRSFDDLAEQLGRLQGRPVSAEQLRQASQQVLQNLQSLENRSALATSRMFWLRFRLISAQWVEQLVRPLAPMFTAWGAVVALSTILLAAAALAIHGVSLEPRSDSFWGGYLLFLVSLIAHELGHAAACARYGAKPSDIGFTMYIIYPALYSDVTAAWRLRRWQRVLVDLGGNYFQYLVGSLFVLGLLTTGAEAFRVAILLILYSSAFSLNPIFKFDGYWMMSDALGVTNLGDQPSRFLRRTWDRLRGRPVEPLPWPPRVVMALAVYTPLTFAFWGYFLAHILPSLHEMTLRYPETLRQAWEQLGRQDIGGALSSLVVSTMLLVIFYFLLLRLFGGLLRPVLRRVRTGLRSRLATASSDVPG